MQRSVTTHYMRLRAPDTVIMCPTEANKARFGKGNKVTNSARLNSTEKFGYTFKLAMLNSVDCTTCVCIVFGEAEGRFLYIV